MSTSQASGQLRAPTAPVYPAAARLPLVGLGTWTQHERGEVEEAVKTAIRSSAGGLQALDLPACCPMPLDAAAAAAPASSFPASPLSPQNTVCSFCA